MESDHAQRPNKSKSKADWNRKREQGVALGGVMKLRGMRMPLQGLHMATRAGIYLCIWRGKFYIVAL